MKVYIVFRNDELDRIFLRREDADYYITNTGSWSFWNILEKEVE